MKKRYAKFAWVIVLFLVSSVSIAQSINGEVRDENGVPMPGVTVMIQGTQIGYSSDLEGRFIIAKAPVGQQVLEFRFIGYKTHKDTIQVPASGSITVNHQMELDAAVLDEYVVVGYGVQRKRDVTGSITKVEGKEVTDIPAPSFEAALQGKAAGVQVVQGSGLAGSASTIRIRGIASISAGGDPLYVVDGIPINQDYFLNGNRGAFNNNPLATINPNDIENIEVLKDAAATGIYGSRGANGVILITTKSGAGKGWSFNLNTNLGVSRPTATPNMLNSAQYLQLYQEAWVNDGNIGLAPLPGGISWEDAQNTDTDWIDETTTLGFKQDYNLGVNYGNQKIDWFMSLGYNGNGSYLEGNSYNRTSIRNNATWRISEKLVLGGMLSFSQGTNNRVNNAWSGGYGDAMSTALPIYPIYYSEDVYNSDGQLVYAAGDFWDQGANPVRQRELTNWKTIEQRTISNLSLEYKPIKNLILKVYGAYEYMALEDSKFTDASLRNGERTSNQQNLAELWPTWSNNFNINGTATYFQDIGEKNEFTYMIGEEYQQVTTRFNPYISLQGAPDVVQGSFLEYPDYLNSNDYPEVQKGTVGKQVYNFISTFGRVNYTRSSKYIGQVTFRVDGSSKFGENNRYGFFPSASVGWIISEENFMKSFDRISFLKLRAGWGVTGNSAIPNYIPYGTYQVQPNGYDNADYRYLSQVPNPNIQWETSNVIDVSLEAGFFKDRLTTTLSFYNKKTTDVLLNLSVQPSNGTSQYWDNAGEILNRGVEFSFKAIVMDRERFTWTMNFNAAYNYNEIQGLGGYSPDAVSGGTNDTRVVVGSPVGTNYLVKFSHVDPETGRNVYLDNDGNETMTWDPDNRQVVGQVLPDAIGGITNTFNIGNWQVGLVLVYSIGSNIYDSSSKRQLGVVTDWNMRTDVFDRWRQPNDQAEYAQLSQLPENYGLSNPFDNNTTQFLKKGDYLRFRRLSVGYNFEGFNIGSMKFEGANITLSAVNFLTFTNFDGLDPEIARDFETPTDRNMSSNITYLTPPQEMSFNLAMNLRF